MSKNNVIHVDFKAYAKIPLSVRYPYIVAYCQCNRRTDLTRLSLLLQAEKDRPGRYALYKSLGIWMMLHDYADQETQEALMDLVSLKGIEP